MSYTAALRALCDDLTVLCTVGGGVDPEERRRAVVHRDAILAAVAEPYRHVAGVSATAVRKPTLDGAAEHPVVTLRALLHRLPPPIFPEQPPIAPRTRAGDLWSSAARNATLMQHAWVNSDPRSWPTGEQRWSALADLAAVAEAVAALDRDLSPRREHGSLPPGLRLTAHEVRQLATGGELPNVPDPRPRPDKPVRVHAVGDLAGAQLRLARLLTDSDHLDPTTVRLVAHAHRRTVAVLAWAFQTSSAPGRDQEFDNIAARLHEHTDALRLPRDRGLATIWPGDPRPAAQAVEIERFVAAWHRSGAVTNGAALLPAARAALHVTGAVARAAAAQLAAGRWLVPDSRRVELRWCPATPFDTPRTLSALHRAAQHGELLATMPVLAPRPPIHKIVGPVAGQLGAALDGRCRPVLPALRPDHRLTR